METNVRILVLSLSKLIYSLRWDEWVPPEQIYKFNEMNIALQKKLSDAAREAAPAAASKAAPSKEGLSGVIAGRGEGREGQARKEPRGHKRGRDEVSPLSSTFHLSLYCFGYPT